MITEKIFRTKIKAYLDRELTAYNIPYIPGTMGVAGVPDILVCYQSFFMGIELKTDVGLTSKLQRHHINRINKNGGVAFVVRPKTYSTFKVFIELNKFNELRKLK